MDGVRFLTGIIGEDRERPCCGKILEWIVSGASFGEVRDSDCDLLGTARR